VDPRTEDKGCALVERIAGEAERCHRVLHCMLDEPPYLARQLWCFTATPTEGYPRDGEFVGRVSPRSETRRCEGTQGFIQVRAAESVIPYVLCGLYCY
jgi:hypothetical protein